jgi:hypothetical protein
MFIGVANCKFITAGNSPYLLLNLYKKHIFIETLLDFTLGHVSFFGSAKAGKIITTSGSLFYYLI